MDVESAPGVPLLRAGLGRGEDSSGPLLVIRGLRGIIVAICAVALAAGTGFGQVWLVVFGALWLAEEIYETGLLALILRAGATESERSSV